MPTALIKFVQGMTTADAGVALFGVPAVEVVASNGNNANVDVFTWRMIDVPPGSAVPVGDLSVAATPTYAFTPDVAGGYLLELTTQDEAGNTSQDRRAFGIKESNGFFIPPFLAIAKAVNFGGQLRGWAKYLEEWLRAIGGGTPSDVIFRPGYSGSGPIYGSWADVAAAVASISTPFRIWCDGACTIPDAAGATSLRGLGSICQLTAGSSLAIGDGASIVDPVAFRGISPESRFSITYKGASGSGLKAIAPTFPTSTQTIVMENVVFAPGDETGRSAILVATAGKTLILELVSTLFDSPDGIAFPAILVSNGTILSRSTGPGSGIGEDMLRATSPGVFQVGYDEQIVVPPFPVPDGDGETTQLYSGSGFGVLGTEVRTTDYQLQPGECAEFDMRGGSLQAILPIIGWMAQGSVVTVKSNFEAEATMTVSPGDGETIDGGADLEIDGTSQFARSFMADVLANNWVVVGGYT